MLGLEYSEALVVISVAVMSFAFVVEVVAVVVAAIEECTFAGVAGVPVVIANRLWVRVSEFRTECSVDNGLFRLGTISTTPRLVGVVFVAGCVPLAPVAPLSVFAWLVTGYRFWIIDIAQ